MFYKRYWGTLKKKSYRLNLGSSHWGSNWVRDVKLSIPASELAHWGAISGDKIGEGEGRELV